MPPPSEDSVTVGELARQVRDVFSRFEGLARRLEDGQFVRTELYMLYKENVNQALAASERAVIELDASKASRVSVENLSEKVKTLDSDKVENSEYAALVSRVKSLEEDKTWLVRAIILFVILGVLGATFAATGGVKP